MSQAIPDVGPLYDTFGSIDDFWRVLMGSVENDAITPVTDDNFHPNLADLLDRFRCSLDAETADALDNYLNMVIEFPYHNPSTPCP
jgi:hypothetical protein